MKSEDARVKQRAAPAGTTERKRRGSWPALAIALLAAAAIAAYAQEKPRMVFEEDVQQFSVSADGKIACAVPHVKRVKKIIIERDDIWVVTPNGSKRRIVDGEKFMPSPPPTQYVVESLAWSPGGRRIALNMNVTTISTEDTSDITGGKQVALLEEDGAEIKVAGSKTRFLPDAWNTAWLTDDSTIVYLTGVGPYKIGRLNITSGKGGDIFEGHTFDAVAWDTARNQAFAVGRNLSISGRLALVQLDLVHETVRELARLNEFYGRLSVSATGKHVGYFENGDTIVSVDVDNPQNQLRVRAGIGRFEYGRNEQRVLLKRGPEEKSGDLVWVGLRDGNFRPILHSLMVHDFRIAPDGESVVITDPGKRILKIFPAD